MPRTHRDLSHIKFSPPKPPFLASEGEVTREPCRRSPHIVRGNLGTVTKIDMLPGIPLISLKEDNNGYRTIP